MSIIRKFKHTTLTLFCLATVLPTLASAQAVIDMDGMDPDIQIESLLIGNLDNGSNGSLDSLGGDTVDEGFGSDQVQMGLVQDGVGVDTLADSVAISAFNVSTRGLSSSAQLAQMQSSAIAQAGLPHYSWSVSDLGAAVTPPSLSMLDATSIQQMQAQIAQMVSLLAKGMRVSPGQLLTQNGPVVLQLALGTQQSQANVAAALKQAHAALAQAYGAVPESVGLTTAGIALDEQLSQSVPKGLVIADQALGANGKLTPQAAKLFGAVKPQPGDSYIMMGDPKVTAEMAKTLVDAGVAPSQMRAVNLTQIQDASTQFSGLNAQLSGLKVADTAGAGKQASGMAINGMAILQVAHRVSPQDLINQTPGDATVSVSLNNK